MEPLIFTASIISLIFLSVYGYSYIIDIMIDNLYLWTAIITLVRLIFGHTLVIDLITGFSVLLGLIVVGYIFIWTAITFIVELIQLFFGYNQEPDIIIEFVEY